MNVNQLRKKKAKEAKKIRQKYLKVIMRKKHLENTDGKYVRWTEDTPTPSEKETVESFGSLGYLIYF
jgi:hypothetical protein